MAVGGHKSTEEVVGGGMKLYTGISNFRILAVNPNKEQLEKLLGIELQSEPKYRDLQMGDRTLNKLTFVLKETEHGVGNIVRLEFLVSGNERLTQDGSKKQYTNKKGQFAYLANPEEANEEKWKWFSQEGMRPAFEGEEDLLGFIQKFTNTPYDEECSLETGAAVGNLDLTEISEIVNALPDNEVRCHLYVQLTDNGNAYQKVYTKYFDVPYRKSKRWWNKNLEGEYTRIKNGVYEGLDYSEWSGDTPQKTPDAVPAAAEGDEAPWAE